MTERERILKNAKKAGIVAVTGKADLETIKLATKLTNKHAPQLMKELEEIRKRQAIEEADKIGVIDVTADKYNGDGTISVETVELATELMKKHGPKAYERLEKRLQDQKNGKK